MKCRVLIGWLMVYGDVLNHSEEVEAVMLRSSNDLCFNCLTVGCDA